MYFSMNRYTDDTFYIQLHKGQVFKLSEFRRSTIAIYCFTNLYFLFYKIEKIR